MVVDEHNDEHAENNDAVDNAWPQPHRRIWTGHAPSSPTTMAGPRKDAATTKPRKTNTTNRPRKGLRFVAPTVVNVGGFRSKTLYSVRWKNDKDDSRAANRAYYPNVVGRPANKPPQAVPTAPADAMSGGEEAPIEAASPAPSNPLTATTNKIGAGTTALVEPARSESNATALSDDRDKLVQRSGGNVSCNLRASLQLASFKVERQIPNLPFNVVEAGVTSLLDFTILAETGKPPRLPHQEIIDTVKAKDRVPLTLETCSWTFLKDPRGKAQKTIYQREPKRFQPSNLANADARDISAAALLTSISHASSLLLLAGETGSNDSNSTNSADASGGLDAEIEGRASSHTQKRKAKPEASSAKRLRQE
ncbi:hypothetical protein SCHPADRAFT_897308 [Schizopora paradoxa]|uniref:Uncharacterized protein n=1 Tax=Schizopora paradoxa TaxID=27342 RepID=A0A0H2QWY7_9AGAM|nr:hypothetical protein SCHPADRAFT_897308 [Schizopora paradoxa]